MMTDLIRPVSLQSWQSLSVCLTPNKPSNPLLSAVFVGHVPLNRPTLRSGCHRVTVGTLRTSFIQLLCLCQEDAAACRTSRDGVTESSRRRLHTVAVDRPSGPSLNQAWSVFKAPRGLSSLSWKAPGSGSYVQIQNPAWCVNAVGWRRAAHAWVTCSASLRCSGGRGLRRV